ncbi:cysteine desulfurase family protein [Sphingomonas morindae]|uniref:Cysteine desulfurase n=1 Tax=Sphingomonas morindae TaxID=1541170 RepID=A0ABY4X4R1_9SPHN|nr:cysteine desulfurase family protein [Sphingomonas morindae]USI71887.1 cysteine desulfurase [Sphingomonas morindae]
MGLRIYLDHAATTPLRPVAREALLATAERWANPSSPHAEGRAARAALEQARARLADRLGWRGAILFTSGASEGLATVFDRAFAGQHLISAVEHDAVRRAARAPVIVPVERDGRVGALGLALALERGGERPLVAIQHVNSETGVLQPLDIIEEAVRAAGGLWLCDATQSVGKLALPAGADFIAFSAHKFGGPPGVGALLVRDLATLAPTGGQEQGYRSGTENGPGIAAMAAALDEGDAWMERAAELRAQCDGAIEAAGGEIVARAGPRIPTIAAYRMPGVAAAAQLIHFDLAGFAVSAGSACSSGTLRTSPVLAAMGFDNMAAGEVIRISFGRTTRREEVWRFAESWRRIAEEARARAA